MGKRTWRGVPRCADIVAKVPNCPAPIFLLQKTPTDDRRSMWPQSRYPRAPVSLSSGDEVSHIFTRHSRVQPKEMLITSAKRLLQHYLPEAEVSSPPSMGDLRPRRSVLSENSG